RINETQLKSAYDFVFAEKLIEKRLPGEEHQHEQNDLKNLHADRARLIPIRRLPQTAFWRPTPPDPQPHPLLIPTIRPFHLDLPDGVTIFNAAIQQSNDASQPPAMVLLFNDRVFINRLTREGNALDPAVQAI